MSGRHKLGSLAHQDDRISQLPDDVLLLVLSRLTLKEAVCTSLLGHRWRYLWTYASTLRFDDPPEFKIKLAKWQTKLHRRLNTRERHYIQTSAIRRYRMRDYWKWINRVLRQHQSCVLEEISVRYCMNECFQEQVDDLVMFAKEKRVRTFNLDQQYKMSNLDVQYAYMVHMDTRIAFPRGILSMEKCLSSLYLKGISVTGENLQQLLFKCLALERLFIGKSDVLDHVKFPALPSLNLKHLDLYKCKNLEEIEICNAPNLVSLRYVDDDLQFPKWKITNAPLLVNLQLQMLNASCHYFSSVFMANSNVAQQLQSLAILRTSRVSRVEGFDQKLPQFIKLRHLTYMASAYTKEYLLNLISFLVVSPFLHTLSLELAFRSKCESGTEDINVPKCECKSLKVIEIRGFVGCAIDLELATYLLGAATRLEKIIVNPNSLQLTKNYEAKISKMEPIIIPKVVGESALAQLRSQLPEGAHLLVV